MHDILNNVLSSIQNGSRINRLFVTVPKSNYIIEILTVLYNEGYIRGFSLDLENKWEIRVFLKYYNNEPVIKKIERISKPSRRIYSSYKDLYKYAFPRHSLILLSTSKGLLSDKQVKKQHIGGEVLFKIF